MSDVSFNVALVAGAVAGVTVDVALFPLDTIKTRLQSSQGLWKGGGFNRIYAGIAPVILGSAPTAAVFFCTYETLKTLLKKQNGDRHAIYHHMFAASFGEVVACSVRVPVEVVKQRLQTSSNVRGLTVVKMVLRTEGVRGMFRGYVSTAIREVPFSLFEMPLWEYLKIQLRQWQGREVSSWQSGLCGAVAGGAAAAVTTPLDVAKTRIILAKNDCPLSSGQILFTLRVIYMERGIQGLFAGIVPRVAMIAIGGAVFLGIYQKFVYTLTPWLS